MSENRNHYTSNDLSLNQASSYILLLQVDINSFNYAILSGKRLLAWGENYSLDELRNPQQLNDILTANYRQVITGLHSSGFTLLPQSLFDQDRLADIARMLDVSNTEKIKADVLDNQNIIIYKVDEMLTYAIKGLDNQRVFQTDAGCIKAIADSTPLNNNIYLNIGSDVLSVVNFTDGKLRFYNNFSFKNYDELAYFCILVITELDIKPENTKLIISGNSDGYFTYLKDFFGEVELNNISLLTLPHHIEAHKIFSLSALSLCASSEEN